MDRIEILVEELSMEVFLKGLLPRILPEDYKLGQNCFVYPHEGKNDLQKRLPRRVRAYRSYPEDVKLIVVHDQDSADCIKLKQQLVKLIKNEDVNIQFLVRIACRELENWYLGDLKAVEKVYPKSKASGLSRKAKFRNVDKIQGSREMEYLSKEFGKTSCARSLAPIIDIEDNTSVSFNQFISGLNKFLKDGDKGSVLRLD